MRAVNGPPAPPKAPYVHQEFPKMMFHRTQRQRTVKDAIEQEKLGPEWSDKAFPPEPPEFKLPPCPRCEAMGKKFDAAYKKLEAELDELSKQYQAIQQEHEALLEQTTQPPTLDELLSTKDAA